MVTGLLLHVSLRNLCGLEQAVVVEEAKRGQREPVNQTLESGPSTKCTSYFHSANLDAPYNAF